MIGCENINRRINHQRDRLISQNKKDTLLTMAEEEINIEQIIEKRETEIIVVQIETPRRLSVSHINLGIVQLY